LVLPVGHSFNLSLPVSFTEFDSDSVRSQEAIARTYSGCAALSAAMRHARTSCQRVDNDGDSQNSAGDHVAERRREIDQRQAVGDRLNDDDAKQGGVGAAASAKKTGAADDRSRDRIQIDVAGSCLLA